MKQTKKNWHRRMSWLKKARHLSVKSFSISILSFILLLGCAVEDHENFQQKAHMRLKKTYITLPELSEISGASEKLAEVQQKKERSLQRGVYDSINDFTINTDKILLMESEGYSSITFSLSRDYETSLVENLVLSSNSLGGYTPFLITYKLTDHEREIIKNGGDLSSISPETKIEPLDQAHGSAERSLTIYELNGICVIIDHIFVINGEIWATFLPVACQFPIGGAGGCSTSGSGNGANNGGWMGTGINPNGPGSGVPAGSPGGGGGGNGGPRNPNQPVVTAPVINDEQHEEFANDPCVKLKNLFTASTIPSVKQIIVNELQPNIAVNPSGEKGASLSKNFRGGITAGILPATEGGMTINIPLGYLYYSGIHTHPLGAYPMFSWSDILVLYNMNKNIAQHNAGLASFLLVCKDDAGVFQTYAIVFNNETADVVDMILNSPKFAGMTKEKIAEHKDEELQRKYDKEMTSGTRNYERAFLNQLQNLNVSLYQANADLTDWNRLQLNQTTNSTVKTPCN